MTVQELVLVLALVTGLVLVLDFVTRWVQGQLSQLESQKARENWLQLDSRKAMERSLASLKEKAQESE